MSARIIRPVQIVPAVEGSSAPDVQQMMADLARFRERRLGRADIRSHDRVASNARNNFAAKLFCDCDTERGFAGCCRTDDYDECESVFAALIETEYASTHEKDNEHRGSRKNAPSTCWACFTAG